MESRLLIFYLSPTLFLTLRYLIHSIFFGSISLMLFSVPIQKKNCHCILWCLFVFSICFSNVFWWPNQIELLSAYVVLHIENPNRFLLLLENKILLSFFNQIDPSIFQPPTIFCIFSLILLFQWRELLFHFFPFWIEK